MPSPLLGLMVEFDPTNYTVNEGGVAMLRIGKIGEAYYPVSVDLTIFIISNGKLQWSGWWGWRRLFFLTLSYITECSNTLYLGITVEFGDNWVFDHGIKQANKLQKPTTRLQIDLHCPTVPKKH